MYIAHYNDPDYDNTPFPVFFDYPVSTFSCDWLTLMFTVDKQDKLHIDACSGGHSVTITPAQNRTFKQASTHSIVPWVYLIPFFDDRLIPGTIVWKENLAYTASVFHGVDRHGEHVVVTHGLTSFQFRRPLVDRARAANDCMVGFADGMSRLVVA
jgi:hypothetical protein